MSTKPPRLAVLLIDPLPDERDVYGESLRFSGFDVTVCADPTTALKLAREQPVAAIVTRIKQPGIIDGIEITRRIKTDVATRHIPVIIITSQIQPHFRSAAEAAGCDKFLLLPCLPDRLASELHRLTRRLTKRSLKRPQN